MKKFLLLTPILVCSIALMAQKKKLSETDKATIQNTLAESEKKGMEQWEREKLKKLLYKKYITHVDQRDIPAQVNSLCANSDFENGDYSGWILTSGNINGVNLPCYTCPSTAGGIANITSHTNSGPTWTNGVDNCTGLPVVAPGGGNYSLALNDNTSGGKLQQMKYTFAVANGSTQFMFRYLAILQNAGSSHLSNQVPYFMYRLLDANNNVVPGSLYQSDLVGNPSEWAVDASCGAYQRGWLNVCTDLTAYIGQNVTLDVQVSDCSQGGHYGYAYIDAGCVADSPSVRMCTGSTMQQIIAPAGFTSYQWYGPNNPGNAIAAPNGTNDTLTIMNGQAGDVYYLKDSTALPNGCYGTYSVTLQNTNPMWAHYSGSHVGNINDTGTIYLCQGDTLILSAAGVSTYTWTGGVTNGSAFYPTSSGSYTLAGNSNAGCTDTVVVRTFVQPCNTTGLNSFKGKEDVEIYPNPSRGAMMVRSKNRIDEIVVSDITGRILSECRPAAFIMPLQLDTEGIYFVQVRSGSKVNNLKIVVSK